MEQKDFKTQVKQLRKQYINAMKRYYNDSHILFKMIYERQVYENLYEADLGFRTCMLHRFSDKRLYNVSGINVEKAVEILRGRAMCCLYTASVINSFIEESEPISDNHFEAINCLKQVNKQLCDLAENSLLTSNDWAIRNNLDRYDERLCVDDYRVYDWNDNI